MPETKLCTECGAMLAAYWPRGPCARCAIDGALDMKCAAPGPPDACAQRASPGPDDGSSSRESFGDYDLLEEIARGGMGVVNKARQRSLDRIVAGKMILAGQLAGKEIVQRFRTEASAAAILQHPHIVAVHDAGVHEVLHYFSMDYIEGEDLAHLVVRQPLPAAKAGRRIRCEFQ